jgi:uncharacterized protein
MRVAPGLLVIATVVLLSGRVFAGDIDDAIQAMRAGDFAEAYCILKPYAEKGDAEAQYNIGWMYLNGYGLAMNDSLALEWWQRASDQGNTDASFSIAMLYSLGEGQVKKDMGKAIDYYLLAVRAGHEDASMIIRSMLARDEASIQSRKIDIIRNDGPALGPLYEVKVDRANLRSGPSLEDRVVTVLEQGAALVDLSEKEKWMQVGVLATGDIAWIYKSLLQEQPGAKTSKEPG